MLLVASLVIVAGRSPEGDTQVAVGDKPPPSAVASEDLPAPSLPRTSPLAAGPTTTAPPVHDASDATTTTVPRSEDGPTSVPPVTEQPAVAATTAPSTTPSAVAPADEHVVVPPVHAQSAGPDMAYPLTFDGSREVDGGCTWVVKNDGSKVSVRWPEGTTIRFFRETDGYENFEVRDPKGTVLVRRNQTAEFRIVGGEERLPRCQVSDEPAIWITNE